MDVDNAADASLSEDATAEEQSSDSIGGKVENMDDNGPAPDKEEVSEENTCTESAAEMTSVVAQTDDDSSIDQQKNDENVSDTATVSEFDKLAGNVADEEVSCHDQELVDKVNINDEPADIAAEANNEDDDEEMPSADIDKTDMDVANVSNNDSTKEEGSKNDDTMDVDKSLDSSLPQPEVVEYVEDNADNDEQKTETNDIMCSENVVDDGIQNSNEDSVANENIEKNDEEQEDVEKTNDETVNENTATNEENNTTNNDENAVDDSMENPEDEQAEECVDEEGADEEVSLLPDTVRIPTAEDKERAIGSQEFVNERRTSIVAASDETSSSRLAVNEEQESTDTALIKIQEMSATLATEEKCKECEIVRPAMFQIMETKENDTEPANFLCSEACVQRFIEKHPTKYIASYNVIPISLVLDHMETCLNCKTKKSCRYRYKPSSSSGEFQYLCDNTCAGAFVSSQPKNRFEIDRSLYFIEDVNTLKVQNLVKKCVQCVQEKECFYYCTKSPSDLDHENNYSNPNFMFICNDVCLNLFLKEQPDRLELKSKGTECAVSNQNEPEPPPVFSRSDLQSKQAQSQRKLSFVRKCLQCRKKVDASPKNEERLYWETMTFCNEHCLNLYQANNGKCTVCKTVVKIQNLGKYCVRFGFEMRQFCCLGCLTQFKNGLKLCSYCQIDMSHAAEGFLAQVGEKAAFKDFCTKECMNKYVELSTTIAKKKRIPGPMANCAVCNHRKLMRVEFLLEGRGYYFCSNPCFSAFKFVNTVFPDPCGTCLKYFERKSSNHFELYIDTELTVFCTQLCQMMYIIFHRKIVPCSWCRVKKYNFDMVQKKSNGTVMLFCSTNCIRTCNVSMTSIQKKKHACDQCAIVKIPEYHMTMSDNTTRSFCTYHCVMGFQSQFSDTPLVLAGESNSRMVVPAGAAKRFDQKQTGNKPTAVSKKQMKKSTPSTYVPTIAKVTSLAPQTATASTTADKPPTRSTRAAKRTHSSSKERRSLSALNNDSSRDYDDFSGPPSAPATPPPSTPPPTQEVIKTVTEVVTQIVTVPPLPKQVRNISVGVQPIWKTKGITAKPETKSVECQTDEFLEKRIFVPIPVPMYMPMPMHMYSLPCPIPVPIPLPIPVPVFVPTTRNSANGIMKEIKKIQDKMPADPFEAELLMMAEMVAGEPKKSESDSSDEEDHGYEQHHQQQQQQPQQQQHQIPHHVQQHQAASNAFVGEDVLQMALNQMADEYGQPITANTVDVETAMEASTITSNTSVLEEHPHMYLMDPQTTSPIVHSGRGRKRGPGRPPIKSESKRGRRTEEHQLSMAMSHHHQMEEMEPTPISTEKPDADMCLKFTFGVNAWKQWVMTKNSDIEKNLIRGKPFKNDLLSLTADELNFSLCLFVQEVRKPNGSEYAPDTIYYLVLGIQQHLYENGRVDNIFTDSFYDKFTDCLDEVARKFSVLYNDSQFIVTRVEEEHLWESKQLGAHSPHVLLSTLMFFNTKHFNLTTVEEHMQLSFSHIMKHWKRNPNQQGNGKLSNTRNVLLRFYPPQSSIEGNSRKKKVYEQQENEENALRCPVKLYEFYLSKCPESVKPRNDVFYLQPERSCVPDSPVWYSTQALGREQLSKMLHRVKMVKEINVALLSS